MTTEPTPNTPPEGGPAPAASTPAPANWGDPGPAAPKKGWSGKKTAIAAGIAVVIAAGGGAAIWAGTSSADNSAQQGPGGFGGPGGGQFPRGGQGQGMPGGGFGGGMAALREALHGDFVVSNGSGGYTTERLQTGDVTELSATSVTLTSKDGYKQTYTLDGSTQKTGDVKQGDTNVTVVAKVDGQTATATSLGQALQGQGQRQPGQRRGGDYSARPTT